jgi:hypothetical protein
MIYLQLHLCAINIQDSYIITHYSQQWKVILRAVEVKWKTLIFW